MSKTQEGRDYVVTETRKREAQREPAKDVVGFVSGMACGLAEIYLCAGGNKAALLQDMEQMWDHYVSKLKTRAH